MSSAAPYTAGVTTVSLTDLAQRIVDKQMASGAFHDPAEVVETALALLWNEDGEYWEMVGHKLDEALEDVRAGRVTPHSSELIEDIKRRGRARLTSGDVVAE